MLIIVSDLHFRDNPNLTVPEAETEHFIAKNVISEVEDASAVPVTELEILFLGDIFDINRAAYWTSDKSNGYRPWSDWQIKLAKAQDKPRPDSTFQEADFERHILNVIESIAQANAGSLKLLKQLKDTTSECWNRCKAKPKVRFSYIPGNHDRLVQFSPKTRQALATALHLDGGTSEPFRWVYTSPDYPVLAVHGHVFDSYNFGGGKNHFPPNCGQSDWYDYPPLGDAITTMMGQEIVQRFCREARLELNAPLALSLAVIDEVRPQTAILHWLQSWLKTDSTLSVQLRGHLRDAVVGVINDILKDNFVKAWLKELVPWYQRALITIYKALGRPNNLDEAISLFNKIAGKTKSSEEYADEIFRTISRPEFVQWWNSLKPCPRYFVVGHTHRPLVMPLAGNNGADADKERLYFNSGTWNPIVEQGRTTSEGFVRRDQMTHLIFYKDGEDIHGEERSRWEYWTGNLRRGPKTQAAV